MFQIGYIAHLILVTSILQSQFITKSDKKSRETLQLCSHCQFYNNNKNYSKLTKQEIIIIIDSIERVWIVPAYTNINIINTGNINNASFNEKFHLLEDPV